MKKITAIDGPPGTGKTRAIVEKAESEQWGVESAAITYTNEAAAVLRKRAPSLPAGTIYALSWPFVKPLAQGTNKRRTSRASGGQAYNARPVHHIFDPALLQYAEDAPSNQPARREDALARQLHAWRGEGDPPFDLAQETPKGALKFVLPLARWVQAGCPVPENELLKRIAIDEAQDMSWLELRAAFGLVKKGGSVTAYGDPGQSIFGEAKGNPGSSLPPMLQIAEETKVLSTGYRVGDPVASVAARVLKSYYDRSAQTFRANHSTELLVWDARIKPFRGLVLGYSRRGVVKAFRNWGLTKTGVVPNVAKANDALVLSTGHAAKGAEADDVYLLPWSRVALGRFERRDPATVRLLYVMLTRARRRVFLPRAMRARLPI